MDTQAWINWLSFAWTSLHDFVFFGVYWLLTNKLHLIKQKPSLDGRVARIERILIQHLRLSRQQRMNDIRKEHGLPIITKEVSRAQ